MAEHPKLQTYTAMAAQQTAAITSSFDTWAAFLRTASRLYKYSFIEQLMIHVQRPDATACAEYRLWSEKMRRHVRYGAKGIAIISQVNGAPALRYVFDISDTRPKANARVPYLWQYREEHQAIVSNTIAECFSIPADKGVSFQLATIAAKFAGMYWETSREKILQAVKNTLLQRYSEADAGMAFQDAVAASVSYAVLSRCGLSPEQIFDAEDFTHVYEFSDYESVMALGTAVSQLNDTLLRFLEGNIKKYEREKQALQRQKQINTDSPPPSAGPGDPAAREPQQNTIPQEGPDEPTSGPSSVSTPGQQEITLPSPASPRPEPEPRPVPAENFRITDDHLGEGGPKAKFQMNIAAINTLRQIEAEGRWATPEEQETLSRYVGWGGIPDAFDESKPDWAAEYAELKALLTDAEYASARASVLNAHYTSPVVVKAIYQALANMGFVSGNILDANLSDLIQSIMGASRLRAV